MSRSEYQYLANLKKCCEGFIGKKITLKAEFNGVSIKVNNPNLVGDLLECVFYPFYKEACIDFKEGPKQESPDFFADNDFCFEQKAFYKKPGFDISNFTSLIHQITMPGGLKKKLFKTKYLVYEYDIVSDEFVIKNFWMLNIWDLPAYDMTNPISIQVKKNIWYNIRPGSKTGWSDTSKTSIKFLEKLLECLDKCHHLENNDSLKESILMQVEEAKSEGFL